MTIEALDLNFRSETEAEARAAAIAWGKAEPNVESLEILAAVRSPAGTYWTVTVTLETREKQQIGLGL
jgi:hypothetical protein